MKTKSKIIVTLVLMFCSLMVVAQKSDAMTFTITDALAPPPSFNGGPFFINGQLQTLCLELNETLQFGVPYYGTVAPYAIRGGNDSDNPGDNQDTLDNKSKRLYSHYLDNLGSLDANNKIAIQLAIWRIEEEVNASYKGYGLTSGDYTGLGQPILGLADTYFTNAGNYPLTHYVQVLNLWGDRALTQPIQSVIITPEPGTLLLLGAGLLGLGFLVRRRFN